MNPTPQKKRILIAGATGFIGRKLLESLKDFEVVAIQRHQDPPEHLKHLTNVKWISADLFSLLQCEQAMTDIDVAIYLVHSMLPSARLVQASFQDTDLIMADNFSRSCRIKNVKRIIYLGGIIPKVRKLSMHLQSRLEVESALASSGVPLTSLRAGIIIGAGSSSFEMMSLLVSRLPIMLLPSWTKHKVQPIDIDDVIKILLVCIHDPETKGRTFDIAGNETVTYKELMQITAKVQKRKNCLLPVPFFAPGLSVLWIHLITGLSSSLIRPLVQSLKYDMISDPHMRLTQKDPPLSVSESIKKALSSKSIPVSKIHKMIYQKSVAHTQTVRSVQRLPLPSGKDARWAAIEYAKWLPEAFNGLIRVRVTGKTRASFHILGLKKSLLELELSLDRSTLDRPLFYIVGGLLVSKNSSKKARLEFREVLEGRYLLAAIHDFIPSLPWYLYKYSQALTHLLVMRRFASHLRKIAMTGEGIEKVY